MERGDFPWFFSFHGHSNSPLIFQCPFPPNKKMYSVNFYVKKTSWLPGLALQLVFTTFNHMLRSYFFFPK